MSDDDLKEEPVLAPLKERMEPDPLDDSPGERLGTLFRKHHEQVFRAAYRIAGNAQDAEDVLQTVFLRLLRLDAVQPLSGNLAGYLHLAAVNGALDLVRARSAARSAPLEDAGPRAVADPRGGPERDQTGREIRDRLRRTLTTLSPRTAEIFVLRYFEGLGNNEIARMLDTSESVVAVVLHRARQKLKEEIAPLIGGMP